MIKLQRYLNVLSVVDLLLFFAVIIASSVTERYVCNLEPMPIPILTNGTEDFHPQNTIWDYRLIVLSKAQEYGPEAYHSLYGLILLVAVGYFVLEIWLFCVLNKAINQKRPEFCAKWICWRSLILIITFAASALHMSQLQITCTEAIVVPFSFFRIILLIVVWRFALKLSNSRSDDTIIMTGSEKL